MWPLAQLHRYPDCESNTPSFSSRSNLNEISCESPPLEHLLSKRSSNSTGSTPSFGDTFNNSVVSFTLTAAAGNTGTWDPSGVIWPIAPASNVAANANGDGISIQLSPPNASNLNGSAFLDLG